jgi:hypothetical protein
MAMTRERKFHTLLAVLFTIVGVITSWQLIVLSHRDYQQDSLMQTQVDCNADLVTVLRQRSDARLAVDNATIEANSALVAVLQDLQDGTIRADDSHIRQAIQKFEEAVAAREQPELSIPYVDCRR